LNAKTTDLLSLKQNVHKYLKLYYFLIDLHHTEIQGFTVIDEHLLQRQHHQMEPPWPGYQCTLSKRKKKTVVAALYLQRLGANFPFFDLQSPWPAPPMRCLP
jgi:hypothetical protein